MRFPLFYNPITQSNKNKKNEHEEKHLHFQQFASSL